jgi:hypothetical protein
MEDGMFEIFTNLYFHNIRIIVQWEDSTVDSLQKHDDWDKLMIVAYYRELVGKFMKFPWEILLMFPS